MRILSYLSLISDDHFFHKKMHQVEQTCIMIVNDHPGAGMIHQKLANPLVTQSHNAGNIWGGWLNVISEGVTWAFWITLKGWASYWIN